MLFEDSFIFWCIEYICLCFAPKNVQVETIGCGFVIKKNKDNNRGVTEWDEKRI